MVDNREEKFKEISDNLESLSIQMGLISSNVEKLTKNYSQEKEKEKKSNHRTFLIGLVVGSITGILGNFLVSFVMEVYYSVQPPSWVAIICVMPLIAFFVGFLLRLNTIIERLSKF